MARIAVLGASGYTGRLVVAELARRGRGAIAIVRDPDRLRARLEGEMAGIDEVRVADAADPAGLRATLDDVDVLVTTVGPFESLGRDVLDAAIASRTHYVDVTGEQSFVHWAHTERDVDARRAGVVAVPACGLEFLVGDALAGVAAASVAWPAEAHVAYALFPARRRRGVLSAGTRRTLAGVLRSGALALEDGRLEPERIGESRRLAWFPRPVGPRHAAGVPGGEPITLPRHVAGLRTVRTYLALGSWKAELLQLAASTLRARPARNLLARALQGGGEGPSLSVRAATRWACVAEVSGRDGIARAWANGHDPYVLSATAAVAVAEALAAGAGEPGVLAPSMPHGPGELLDELATRSDLRWSLARPATA